MNGFGEGSPAESWMPRSLAALGAGWLCGGVAGALGIELGTAWTILFVLLPGAGLLGAALHKLARGWRLPDMRKGARAEETVGLAIEYALTRERCAVAHNVEGIARFAALSYLEGKLIYRTEQQHTHLEWLRFLKQIDRAVPKELAVHIIADNYSTHKHAKVTAWLGRHGRFHMHFTPTSVGDIDHLVATPRGLWVIETKHGRVPRPEFQETLRRIALNVQAVRDWAPRMRVTGCLVFASVHGNPPKPTYEWGTETIRCFESATSLMREVKAEAHWEGGSTEIAREVWRLGRVDGARSR